jgi:proteasome assembly chaperone (PAC2) family protein
MEHVRWRAAPSLDEPVVVAAFGGWNDAGDASTTAVRFLADQWDAEPFAELDPEDFYDFTETRPTIELGDDGVTRNLRWPTNELAWAAADGLDHDVVLLSGVEPQLRWRTFCQELTEVITSVGARLVITTGALLAEVPHSRAVPVFGHSQHPELAERFSLRPSSYEGPTGIVGALHHSLSTAGIPTVSLWASVPSYVPTTPSPKAALALVDRLGTMLDVSVDTALLHEAAQVYTEKLDELAAADEETTAYIANLEADFDRGEVAQPEMEAIDPDHHGPLLADEIERFLRDQS